MVDERRWREGGWRGIEINVRGQSSRRCIMHRQTQVDGQEDRRMGNISKIFSAKRSFAITLVAFFSFCMPYFCLLRFLSYLNLVLLSLFFYSRFPCFISFMYIFLSLCFILFFLSFFFFYSLTLLILFLHIFFFILLFLAWYQSLSSDHFSGVPQLTLLLSLLTVT